MEEFEAGRKPDTDQDHVRILEQAASWFAVMHGGEPSAADRRALDAWCAADARHAEAYANIERLWQGAIELPGLKQHHEAMKKTISRRKFGAALVLAAAGLGAWQYLADYPFADYRTAKGERRRISLADGSSVDLATETRLSAFFTARMRRLVLYTGEAFFTVAADASRPFAVEAGAGRTTALGTAFGIAHDGGGTTVTVAEHTVNVALGRESANLSAGSSLTYDNRHMGAPHKSEEAPFAWREGRLIFTRAPLGEAIAALNRWRTGHIMIMSSALAARPVTLIVNIDRTEAIVSQLAAALPLRVVDVTPYLTLLFPHE